MKPLVSICLLSIAIALTACSEAPTDEAAAIAGPESTGAGETAANPGEVAEAAAVAAGANAPGAMLYPDLPGASQSCLGVEGPIEAGAQVVLHACNLPKDYLFATDATGKLFIAGYPDLCFDLESPGMGKEAVLILNACNSASMDWMTTASTLESAPVGSDSADCLKVIDSELFPFDIGITPCPENAEVTAFFLEKP